MKKYKVLPTYVFYIAFFVINYFNSFSLLRGWFNPNISASNDFLTIFLAFLGDFGLLVLIYYLSNLIFKKEKHRMIALLATSAILTLFVLFIDAFSNMFYTFFSYSQLTSFKNPTQGKLISGYVKYFARMFLNIDFIIPICLYLILCTIFIFTTLQKKDDRRIKESSIGTSIGLLGMVVSLVVCLCGINNTANEVSMNGVYGSSQMGLYNYYIYGVNDLFASNVKIDKEKKQQLEEFLQENEYSSSSNSSISKGNNLTVLQLEAINNFVIDLKIDGELIAPNLTKLSNNHYYNSNFYSTAGMGNTSDVEFSTLIGLYPNGNDLSIFETSKENYPSIANEFSKIGYSSFSIHGNDGSFYNRNNLHVSLFGFDEHIDKVKLLESNKDLTLIKDWISDESLLEESINIYKKQTKPFFSYNILVSSHSPYTIVDPIVSINNDNLTFLANDYLSYVRYVDSCVGKFVEDLKTNNLYDNSTIVLFGDHTSSLLKQDVESITNKNYKDIEFRKEMQNVPFIIIDKNIEAKNDKTPRCNIDIFATLADIFDLSPSHLFGKSMLSNDSSLVYNPRSLDIIGDNYIIESTTSKVIYSKDDEKLNKKEIKTIIEQFEEYKYLNDLLLASDYFN